MDAIGIDGFSQLRIVINEKQYGLASTQLAESVSNIGLLCRCGEFVPVLDNPGPPAYGLLHHILNLQGGVCRQAGVGNTVQAF